MSVECLYDLLEGDELNNSVWNLSHPEWLDTSIKTGRSLGGRNVSECLNTASSVGSWLGGLHSNLNGLPWAEENISNKLSAGRGDSETNGSVLWLILAGGISVNILENLVETEFTESLGRVSNESWQPSEGESSESISGLDGFETITNTRV